MSKQRLAEYTAAPATVPVSPLWHTSRPSSSLHHCASSAVPCSLPCGVPFDMLTMILVKLTQVSYNHFPIISKLTDLAAMSISFVIQKRPTRSPMTATPLLPPNLTLELYTSKTHPRPRNGIYHLLALQESKNLVTEPIRLRSHGSITDFSKSYCATSRLRFWWKVDTRVGTMSDYVLYAMRERACERQLGQRRERSTESRGRECTVWFA